MNKQEEGLTLLQVAKLLKLQPKRILSFEYNGLFSPPFRRKGRRLVRFFPPTLVEMLGRAAVLLERGYGPKLAFYMATRGEMPVEGAATTTAPEDPR